MILLHAITACLAVAAPANARAEVCSAYVAWAPTTPQVSAVRWCAEGAECARIDAYGGGIYEPTTNTVVLSLAARDLPLTRSQQTYLLLVHELGHALGLDHAQHGVMRSGWDEIAWWPTGVDRAMVGVVRGQHGAAPTGFCR